MTAPAQPGSDPTGLTPLLATSEDLDAFFVYLNDHLSDNGANGAPLFQPIPRGSSFGPERQAAFRKALATALDAPGWRRLWLVKSEQGVILGHIDLRARPEGNAHRVLLGMGVDRSARRMGLGERLLQCAADWARTQGIDWIDLEVLAVNAPARRLYERFGFVQTGLIPDMFHVDGERLDYVYMSYRL